MSVEKINQFRYRCVCELPDCPGNKKSWLSRDKRIPERCRWCLRRTWNGGDKRPQRLITAYGRTQRVAQWAKESGISKQTIRARLEAGRSPEEAVSKPTASPKKEP